MRTIFPLLAAVMLVSSPVMAQDFLKPLQDLVQDLDPRQSPPPRRATPPVKAETPSEPPPVPRPRPDDLGAEPEVVTPAPEVEVDAPEPAPVVEPEVSEPEPAPEPTPEPVADAKPQSDRIYQTACPALLSGKVVGEMLPPIEDGICGERSPLLVTALNVGGRSITLSSPLTTNCEMAGALVEWAGEVDAYAGAALNSKLAELQTGTSFMCRNRVSDENGFTSEHGFANAVDLTGFTLENGTTISVQDDWMPATTPEGKLLRQSHGAACGHFTTVLGPEANADHEDHLHLDLGCHGKTCTAQICE